MLGTADVVVNHNSFKKLAEKWEAQENGRRIKRNDLIRYIRETFCLSMGTAAPRYSRFFSKSVMILKMHMTFLQLLTLSEWERAVFASEMDGKNQPRLRACSF